MTTLKPSGSVTAKIFPHPMNTWYAVAWDHEVNRKGILSRTIADQPMALYRKADGRRSPWPTRAGTVWPRCRWASSSVTRRSRAPTTA